MKLVIKSAKRRGSTKVKLIRMEIIRTPKTARAKPYFQNPEMTLVIGSGSITKEKRKTVPSKVRAVAVDKPREKRKKRKYPVKKITGI